jgi:hypothetical protein
MTPVAMAAKRILAILAVIAGFVATAASAWALEVHLTVHPGSLGITATSATGFQPTGRDAHGPILTAALSGFTVVDATGTGAGWHVTMSASPVWSTSLGSQPAAPPIPTGSMLMAAPAVSADGTDSPVPLITPGPYPIDLGGASIVIATAEPERGMGTYDFSAAPLTLRLPAGAAAQTYGISLSVVVAIGP